MPDFLNLQIRLNRPYYYPQTGYVARVRIKCDWPRSGGLALRLLPWANYFMFSPLLAMLEPSAKPGAFTEFMWHTKNKKLFVSE